MKEVIETNGKCQTCGHSHKKHSISGKVCRAFKGNKLGPCDCQQFVSAHNGTDSRIKVA